jgi:multidrug efflux pump subunit AcrB
MGAGLVHLEKEKEPVELFLRMPPGKRSAPGDLQSVGIPTPTGGLIPLTAAAVVVGSFVMLFDPIFQGLVIAMMFGAVAATVRTLLAVPLLYFEFFQHRPCPLAEQTGEACEVDKV